MKIKVLKNVWLRIAMIVAVVTTAFAGNAWAEDVTTTFNGKTTSDGVLTSYTTSPANLIDVEWKTSIAPSGYEGGIYWGKSQSPAITTTISGAIIKAVTVNAKTTKGGSISVSVGGTSIGSETLTQNAVDHSFTNNTTTTGGEIKVNITAGNGNPKNYIYSITVTYEFRVTVGDALYTTFVTPTPVKVSFPTGLTAYIVTQINPSSIHLEEITNVPAETPVIVKAESANTYKLTVVSSGDNVSDNKLIASTGDGFTTTNGTEYYALANIDEVGFYPVESGVTIPAGKAYLHITSGTPSGVKGYVFDFDEATGIKTIDNGQQTTDTAIYNLAGQRLNKMQKGINIVNGKKILF